MTIVNKVSTQASNAAIALKMADWIRPVPGQLIDSVCVVSAATGSITCLLLQRNKSLGIIFDHAAEASNRPNNDNNIKVLFIGFFFYRATYRWYFKEDKEEFTLLEDDRNDDDQRSVARFDICADRVPQSGLLHEATGRIQIHLKVVEPLGGGIHRYTIFPEDKVSDLAKKHAKKIGMVQTNDCWLYFGKKMLGTNQFLFEELDNCVTGVVWRKCTFSQATAVDHFVEGGHARVIVVGDSNDSFVLTLKQSKTFLDVKREYAKTYNLDEDNVLLRLGRAKVADATIIGFHLTDGMLVLSANYVVFNNIKKEVDSEL